MAGEKKYLWIVKLSLLHCTFVSNNSSRTNPLWIHSIYYTYWVTTCVPQSGYDSVTQSSQNTGEICKSRAGCAMHPQHLMPAPMDIKVPKVPPDCSITFPTLFMSSRPRNPYLWKEGVVWRKADVPWWRSYELFVFWKMLYS